MQNEQYVCRTQICTPIVSILSSTSFIAKSRVVLYIMVVFLINFGMLYWEL